ncbi:hypothetical protein D3C84_845340 [compost metagenome]
MPEQKACGDGQDIACCRDLVGTKPQPHAPDGGPASRDRPDRPGDEVGDAFVGTVEQGLLKMRLIGVGDWRDPRRIEFAQLRLHRGGHGAGNHFAQSRYGVTVQAGQVCKPVDTGMGGDDGAGPGIL